ncbi:asparagine--tRNA ligase [Alicyclobacillus ferrooxydans]|uniref:Asparagine--tRNA ligase n=1 Tax=Alicyclobacillus ferrooxydans TaxID=471514 RepID=A0A0P9EHW5_9BACL|nr:asparagine--tRNA ligase [Alicyclobacillus ferrooxydans]KPV42308.1 asparaginyl-tRNA synthetase [Alicyclobacillus ferrooxydans]
MKRFTVKELFAHASALANQSVSVTAWVRTVRDSKTFGFLELNDGSFFKNVQVVFDSDLENFSDVAKLPISSTVTVEGTLIYTPDAKQAFEIRAAQVRIDGYSVSDYPLQKKRHSFEYLRSIAHLRPRTNTFSAVFRVRSLAAFAIHQFFQERGFVYVNTPIITTSDAEGAGEMFRLTTGTNDEFFGKPASLTVSGQLNAEAYSLAFGNVYTFGPTFRAENSNTARHAAEFWMIEPEMAFAELADLLMVAEDMVKHVIHYVLEHAPEEMAFFDQFVEKGLLARLQHVVESDFARVGYSEAIELLKTAKVDFEYPVSWGLDLQSEHERYLCEQVFKRPVFVTDYPKDIKAFYMRMNDDGKTVAASDLLVPGIGELIGGSQREERLEALKKRMVEMGLNPEEYAWYLELRAYGETKHAGFGLGFERLLMYLTGMSNIRDVIPFPRTVGHAEF